jgi:uncharacterized protein YqhQ
MEHNTHTQDTKNSSYHTSMIAKSAITVALVLVINMFFNYAVSFVYPEPEYTAYVPDSLHIENPRTEALCVEKGGQWTASQEEDISQKNTQKSGGYCNVTYKAQKAYDTARKEYDKAVFMILVVLGVISLVASVFVHASVLPVAFSWAGVVSLLIASVRYWGSAGKLTKLVLLASALCALIWLAVKKFNK